MTLQPGAVWAAAGWRRARQQGRSGLSAVARGVHTQPPCQPPRDARKRHSPTCQHCGDGSRRRGDSVPPTAAHLPLLPPGSFIILTLFPAGLRSHTGTYKNSLDRRNLMPSLRVTEAVTRQSDSQAESQRTQQWQIMNQAVNDGKI